MTLRRWALSPAGLLLSAWLMLWRVATAADIGAQAGATLLGVGVDVLVVWAGCLLHRRVAGADPLALGARVLRYALAAGVAALGAVRALAATAAAVLGHTADEAYWAALHAHPEWLWGLRWLLVVALLGGPLAAWCLRVDARGRVLDVPTPARAEPPTPRP